MALTRFQDNEQILKDIQELARQLENLRKTYEQYFLGLVREEPEQLRKDVKALMQKHTGTPIQNASIKFQLQQSIARYNTFSTYWDRILREIEEGKYKRDVFKANLHEKERKEKTGPIKSTVAGPAKKKDMYENLFDEYKELKKQLKQDVSNLSFDAFRDQLKKKLGELHSSSKDKNFSFKVVQENKEIKIKLQKKKPDPGK
ncbi:MAG: MXAN_5187 C-terminal domain-containing protein [Bdellovibrionota bacterium]